MAINVNFYRGRMHVGNRMKDWSDVWLELDVPEDDQEKDTLKADREYDFDLYKGKFKTGGSEGREPDAAEVVWHSHFDVATFQAKTRPAREKMQRQFLSDAWLYLSARDPKKVKNLEDQLDQPAYARWQSWFRMAKKYKRRQIRNLNNGINDDDDDDDDDSAYDSDEDRQRGPMPPPRKPAKSKKRPSPEHGSQNKGSKKAKQERDEHQTRLSFTRYPDDYAMSGGRGPRSNRSGSIPSNLGNDLDDTEENEIYDPSPPEGFDTVENTVNGNDLNNVGSPAGIRRRGNSREDSLQRLNEWNLIGDSRESAGSRQNSIGDDVDDVRRFAEINGNIDEAEAFRRAMRESEEPSGDL